MAPIFVGLFGHPQGVIIGLASFLVGLVIAFYAFLEGLVPGCQLPQLVLMDLPPFLLELLPDVVFLS